MPESSGEKTEKATPKKRKDERKEGNIFQSKEIEIAFSLAVTFYSFKLLFPLMRSQLQQNLTSILTMIKSTDTFSISDSPKLYIDCCITFFIAVLPILLISAAAAVIPTIAQTRGLVSFKNLSPKFSRLSILNGIKKMFSFRGLAELFKSILKILLLFYVIYAALKDKFSLFPKMFDMTLEEALSFTGSVIMAILNKAIIAFVFIAIFDYMFQRWQYEKNLRMTKQEIKEEYKQIEGDPKVKGQIRQRQQAAARRRMMQAVPQADVIIRNPTHFAVALKYDAEKNKSPVLVAKGADSLALKIIEVAKKHDITIVENKPLARALYAEVDLDREIPADFYQPVAEVLAYVYSLKKKDLKSD